MKTDQTAIEIRFLNGEDSSELRRLAELDTAETPPQPLLGGIVDGRLVAARSLHTGESIADPFLQTTGISSLLAHRARQLNGGRIREWLRRGRRNRAERPRGRRAGSPPGPADRLYLLPRKAD
jgi:hypothetical protein